MQLRLLLPGLAESPSPQLLAGSVAGWTGLLCLPHSLPFPVICGGSAGGLHAWREVELALRLNFAAGVALPWLMMLLATMPPLLCEPLVHLWTRSLARRRRRAVLFFLAGYSAIWAAAGVPLTAAALALRAMLDGPWLVVGIAAAVALLWQSTPAKQGCLNRCHRRPRLVAFGLAADRDCLRFGLGVGASCVGACWALMLVPLVVAGWHLTAMAAVSALLLAERRAPGRPARWLSSLQA